MFISSHVDRKWECKLSPVCPPSMLGAWEPASWAKKLIPDTYPMAPSLKRKPVQTSCNVCPLGPGESEVRVSFLIQINKHQLLLVMLYLNHQLRTGKTHTQKNPNQNKIQHFLLSLRMVPSSSWLYARIQKVVGLVIRNVSFSIGSQNNFKTYRGKPGKFCCLFWTELKL